MRRCWQICRIASAPRGGQKYEIGCTLKLFTKAEFHPAKMLCGARFGMEVDGEGLKSGQFRLQFFFKDLGELT
jgi:hypothetical protein